MKTFGTIVLAIINSVGLACTISGQTFQTLTHGEGSSWTTLAIAFSILLVLQLVFSWILFRSVDSKRLKEGTRRFANFFQSWYAAQGDIFVYCTDLEWLEGDEYDAIVDTLRKKGRNGRAFVFLRRIDSPRVRELVDAGVKIYPIPPEVQLRTRLSLRVDDDSRSIIIRTTDKSGNGGREPKVALVRSTADQYLCLLAWDLLATLRTQPPITFGRDPAPPPTG